MEQVDYRARFHQALSKAFAAQSAEARAAYFDLASYYREKLDDPADLYPEAPDYRTWVRS